MPDVLHPYEEKIRELDLESLDLIRVLFVTESLSKTAAHLRISISKASRSLGCARKVFDDELFIRSASTMAPTKKMQLLYPAICSVFEGLSKLLEVQSRFVPQAAHGTIRIAASDNAFAVCVAPFLEKIVGLAPNLHFEIVESERGTAEDFRTGEVDFLVIQSPSFEFNDHLHSTPLLRCRHVLMMRKGHPLKSKLLDPAVRKDRASWLAAIEPWTMFTNRVRCPSGYTMPIPVSQIAAASTPVMTPYFVSPALLLPESDRVMIGTEALAKLLSRQLSIETVPIPFLHEWEPSLIWHDRTNESPLNEWVRAQLISLNKLMYGEFSALSKKD